MVVKKGKDARKPRPHPYADEPTSAMEERWGAKQITLFWVGLATILLVAGLLLANRYSTIVNPGGGNPAWEQWTLLPLFAGLALLGFGFVRETWSKRLTLLGWILFGFYWGLTAQDLLISEDQDYVNFIFAMVGVYFFTYLAYHQWLSLEREVPNDTIHFLNVATFVAAGTYFLIDKITVLRVALIELVGNHTNWGLELFGQGSSKGLVFEIDKMDSRGPVTFYYPDTRYTTAQPDGSWLDSLLFWTPEGDLAIVPVSIILACTAIQSIMLFVGLFVGTQASWQRKLKVSVVVGAIIYALNLVRNVGIIWFYGRGHASFWVMHNAVGKGGSLIAMVAIAFGVFKFFPEFFRSLVGVLDLVDRDGPVEQTLRMGRRRPTPSAVSTSETVRG